MCDCKYRKGVMDDGEVSDEVEVGGNESRQEVKIEVVFNLLCFHSRDSPSGTNSFV